MVYGFKIGEPFETEAVIELSDIVAVSVDVEETAERVFGECGIALDFSDGFCAVYNMSDDAVVYGLGETNRGMNKRGHRYVSFNTDEPNHTEEKESLYSAHNFVLIKDGKKCFGIFVDYPGEVVFDIGYEHRKIMKITSEYKDMFLYFINGDSLAEITAQFRKMIGKSYIAPKWAFGFQQCRWSYMNAAEIREVVNKYRAAGIPLDAVYLDIDYMQDYKNFTINPERFPDFREFVTEMLEQGIRLVPIIDAGVKIEPGYDVYEEGKAQGFFCSRDDGSLYAAGVWPGRTHFPDFLNPAARAWFGAYYKRLTDLGIEGFWNDMNEPALFYTDESIGATTELLAELKKRDEKPGIEDCMRLRDTIDRWRDKGEYKKFYHNFNGKRVRHDRVHNLYGCNMTRAAAEALLEAVPDKRTLLFSRSSYIGMHRYAGMWMGDNHSWWSHILMNLQMLPGLNMCGFIYSGADIGGFNANATEDLLLRWTALGIFTPLFRNHSANGTRRQECYRFDSDGAFKELISLRYRLIPYLYSEYLKAAYRDELYFRPLSFDYEDDNEALMVEDQLLLGEGLMIAPVYKQNAKGRYVYLPEDMLLVTFDSSSEYTLTPMTKGHYFISVGLTQVPVFIRKGHMLPLGVAEVCTDDMRRYNDAGGKGTLGAEDFEIIDNTGGEGEYIMYTEGTDRLYENKITLTNKEIAD